MDFEEDMDAQYEFDESDYEGSNDSNSNEDSSDYTNENNKIPTTISLDLPLYQRLELESSEETNNKKARDRIIKKRKIEKLKDNDESYNEHTTITKKSKNAPTEMRSDKPVRRLRVTGNNSLKKTMDPRFSDISGKLNEDIFSKNYTFLDEYRENEINVLNKTMKQVKNDNKKDEIKKELIKMKQEYTERKRSLKVKERLNILKQEEYEKTKNGKKPFYLKKSVINTISLEERYKELKKEGKLHKFMEKKRKKNANKDHRWIPSRRTENS